MKQLSILTLFLFNLISCSQEIIKDEDSYIYSIPTGSKLILNQSIPIAANLGRTYFQNGKVTSESDINIYYPHCSITVNTILAHDRTISPTTFEIYKIEDDEEYAQGYILYASTKLIHGTDGPLITGLVSYYYLKSSAEPDVRTLECIQWNTLYENKHLSISEVRKSLGDIFTLNLNE